MVQIMNSNDITKIKILLDEVLGIGPIWTVWIVKIIPMLHPVKLYSFIKNMNQLFLNAEPNFQWHLIFSYSRWLASLASLWEHIGIAFIKQIFVIISPKAMKT